MFRGHKGRFHDGGWFFIGDVSFEEHYVGYFYGRDSLCFARRKTCWMFS